MQHVFWLVPRRLAGRPGPHRRPWRLAELRASGIDAVLSVNDGEGCDLDELRALGFQYRCVPMPPSEPPLPGDDDVCRAALPEAHAWVIEQHRASGKDRTGMFMSYFLMREEGLDLDASIARVREVRPIALTAMGWEAMAREVLADLATRG